MFKDGDLVRIKDDANLSAENFANMMLGIGIHLVPGMQGKVDKINRDLGVGLFVTDKGACSVGLDVLEHVPEKVEQPTINGVTLEITFDGENLEISSDTEISYPTQYEQALANVVAALYELVGVGFDE